MTATTAARLRELRAHLLAPDLVGDNRELARRADAYDHAVEHARPWTVAWSWLRDAGRYSDADLEVLRVLRRQRRRARAEGWR